MASYHVLTPIHPYDPNFPQPITSLAFDSNSDVIWAGSGSGILSAYSGSHMRTVYFPVGGHVPVKKIVSSESEVRAIGDAGIGSWRKGGANSWYLKYVYSRGSNQNSSCAISSNIEVAL